MKYKYPLLCSAGLLVTLTAMAQHPFFRQHTRTQAQENMRRIENLLLQTGSRTTGQKPTGFVQRVIAQSAGGDSTRYTYSGTHGSAYNYYSLNELVYPDAFDLTPAADVPSSYNYAPASIQADSIYNYSNATLKDIGTATYTGNRLDAFADYNLEPPDSSFLKSRVTYNADDRADTLSRVSGSITTTENMATETFSYNNQGQLTTDSLFNTTGPGWNIVTAIRYHYNAAGRLDTAFNVSYGDAMYAVFRYDPSGQLETMSVYGHDNGVYQLEYRDSFAFTAGIGFPVFYRSSIHEDNQVVEAFQMIKYPSVTGKIDSVQVSTYDGNTWTYEGTVTYRYNDFDNPDMLSVRFSDGSSAPPVIFYYETYDNAAGIGNIAQEQTFDVFPNPFTTDITIRYTGVSKSHTGDLSLMDISGRMLLRKQMDVHPGANTISVPPIPEGIYILTVTDEKGNSFCRKMLKK